MQKPPATPAHVSTQGVPLPHADTVQINWGGSGPVAANMSVAPEGLPALLDAGSSMQYVRVQGMSPLLYCCAAYDEEMAIRLLLEGAGVDMDEPDISGYTPLHYAADAGLADLAAALLQAGCGTCGWTDDMPSPFGPPVPGGKTALHLAAARGDKPMVRLLLGSGAERRRLDIDGNTAYELGCMHGHFDPDLRPPGALVPTPEVLAAKQRADSVAATERLAELVKPQGRLLDVVRHPCPQICTLTHTTWPYDDSLNH